jgi:4a-hydroxytetrahydrobiopterin dehydratase
MMNALTADEISEKLKGLEGWSAEGDKIGKDFAFSNFKEALAFLVRVGLEAETQGHHPEIFNVYNSVTIKLSTHDAGDKVTQKDIDLANAIENI